MLHSAPRGSALPRVSLLSLLLLLGVPGRDACAQTPSQIGTWGPVLDWGVQGKHMMTLPTGKVLVWPTGLNCRVWDPATGAFISTPATFGDLHCAAQAALADGRTIVVGGQNGSPHVGTKVTALFDPFSNTWTQGATMNYERWYSTATTLPDGRLLAMGGDDASGNRVTLPEIYDPVANTWTVLTGASRSQGLYPFMYALPNGKIFEAGTSTGTALLDIAGTGSWTTGPTNPFGSNGYSESDVTFSPGKIMRTGGGDPAMARVSVIDMTASSPQWREIAPMSYPRRRHNLVILLDGTVMAVGGTRSSDSESQAVLQGEIWDPITEQWTTVAAMSEARMYHSSAVLLPDGRVVAAGGEAAGRLHAQVYTPPYFYKGARPTITAAPASASYGTTFTISTPDGASIDRVAILHPTASTHAIDMNERYVPLTFSISGGNLLVNAPANSNLAPPGYYLLVIRNSTGVPSVASWIRLGGNLTPGTISGRVTATASGAGISGATVSYNGGTTTTNGTGDYLLSNASPGEHTVTASATGYGSLSLSVTVAPGGTTTANFQLAAPGSIAGRVTSLTTGSAISGALVSYGSGSTTTNSTGDYRIDGLPAGNHTLTVSLFGYKPADSTIAVASGALSTLHFALDPEHPYINGEVVDASTSLPIVGATVSYSGGSTLTDGLGRYQIPDVAPGTYDVTASAGGYLAAIHQVVVAQIGYTTSDFALDPVPSGPGTTRTFTPIADAHVKVGSTTNEGTITSMRVRFGSPEYDVYVKFAPSLISGPVQNAKLRLYVVDASDDAGTAYKVSNGWTETGITGPNAPPIAGNPLAAGGAGNLDSWVEYDVTAAVLNGDTISFALKTQSTNSCYFSTREGAQPPQLVVRFGGPAPTPPAITSLTPATGVRGSVVTLAGRYFTGMTAVEFNGSSAAFTVDSDTTLRATVPATATSGPIRVVAPTGSDTSATSFSVLGPLVTGLSPASGLTGSEVAVDGFGFLGATAVAFNGTPATFIVDSDIRLRAIVPSGASAGAIRVTTPGGTALSASNFTPVLPPSIFSFTPDRAAVGASVTLRGREFFGVTVVTFNGLSATSYTVQSDTVLTAVVPSGATTGRLGVTTAGGAAQSSTNLLVLGAGASQSFAPLHDAQVTTSNPANNYGTLTELRVRNSSPSYDSYLKFSLLGLGPVVRKATLRLYSFDGGPDGGSVYVVSNNYLGTSTPWIETGLNYSNAPAMSGAPVAPPQVVANDTYVDFDVTSALAGNGTYSFGLRNANTNSVYYVSKEGANAAQRPALIIESDPAPGIGSFTPGSGAVSTAVTIRGVGFAGASSVRFNGISAAYGASGDTVITATVPVGASTGPITVTNPAGTATGPGNFTVFQPPAITTFNPASGPAGTEVTLHGARFTLASAVRLNGTAASFTADNDSTLRATVPAGATSGPVSVTNTGGATSSATSFTVITSPVVTFFTPTSGPAGTLVTVHGVRFATTSAVRLNGVVAVFTVDSDTTLRATVPAGATSGTIAVTNPGGTGTSAASFSVIQPPTLLSFTPSTGPVGTVITIHGAHLSITSLVRFNGTSATFLALSDTTVRATVPAGATSGAVTVTNPAGTATSGAAFSVVQPPTLASFNPASGPVGTEVTLQGASFATASAVAFNGAAALFTIVDDATLRATVPAGATSGAISVTNPAGATASAASFSLITSSGITSFSPTSGPAGTEVTIHGLNFSTASAVTFNGTSAVFTIGDDATLHAIVPVGAASGAIRVTNPAGTTASASSFTVIPLATVTSFEPATGPVGLEVTIRGTAFATASAVAFNGTAATFTVDNDAALRATVPVGATSGSVSVTNPAGTTGSASTFTVIPLATVTSFEPASGPVGAQVTIHGAGFSAASAITFNGSAATFTIDDGATLRATVPVGATSGSIAVTNPAGTTASASSFTVIPLPTVTLFEPAGGPAGVEVTIHGAAFATASAVAFNGSTATFTIDGDTTLRATVPVGATSGSVSVTNPAGTTVSAGSFEVILAAVITTFTPTSGTAGVQVTLHGSRFATASAVHFNGVSALFTIRSDTLLRATLPSGADSGPISVTNPAGTTVSSASFAVLGFVTFTTFSPAGGPVGTEVTIQGNGFAGATSVRFNGTLSTFVVDSGTQLRAIVPAGATTGPISVGNPLGTFTGWASFTVLAPPIVASFDHESGAPPGTEVTIHGAGFSTVSEVRFNATVAAFTVECDTLLRSTVPAAASSGPLSVTNAAGSCTTSVSFTVLNPVTLVDPGMPREFALGRSTPNPFQARTRIAFELPRAVHVRLTIFDVGGRSIRTLVKGQRPAGVHELSWDGRDDSGSLLGTGVYLIRLQAGDFTATRRISRVR